MKTHQPIQASAPDNMQTAKPASRHGLPRRTHRPSALTNGPRKPHLAVSDAPVQAEPESDPFGTGEAPEEDLAPVSVEEHESASLFTDGESGFDALQTLSQEDHENAALSLEPPAPVDISHEFVPTRLAEHRKALMRMARLRVRSHEWAEDAVQEALIAAYQSRGSYRGRGSVRSWLRGILDHKIHDRFRAECHYTQADWIDDESASAEEQLDWAARCGVMGLRAHEDPMEICSRRQRLQRVAQGLNDMAPGMREAFMLQVVEDRPSVEVADRLGISENNCWIRVHRARKKLIAQRED
ncbi:MAG: RNA polymerase sigma factor [Betaproteobacteria bacterium]|nr:RNA polymerase sigma factor [Betaproteobacteria bacterium]NBP10499.1 RNA polymerase sigma factor [Betaproteobacteria bacterium]NBP61437.1 RNA polymerase sigma factor [Betaproteobacteria bacterium]NBQ08496.1 RNA polymerase sigma factor [Betaproteobacteria bacterium]NBQ81619.1 RNA polymerase sigma factor [Betaproteobacteria bacterium]